MVNQETIGYFIALLIVSIGLPIAINATESQIDPFESPGNISDVHLWLWTRSNPGDEDYYTLENGNLTNLMESPFEDTLKTYFIFHGYGANGKDGWILQGKTNILYLEDCNYISVDYSAMVPGPNYNAAVNNVYVTAEFIGSFIDWLVEVTALETTRIQIVGWSLGAHAAGMTASYTTSGRIDRITGLDPAGPLFYNVSADQRLDKSQANFVDVIHTNGGKIDLYQYGLLKPVGHVDFYPNGGQRQPGCWLYGGCSHERAPKIWVESILAGYPSYPNGTDNIFVSWPCQDWDTFDQGGCPTCGVEGCLEMGFHLNDRFNASSLYFLRTSSSPPFALGNVQG